MIFKQFKTICVVGNSSVLLGSKLGGKIDSHDCVIRFNYAPLTKKFAFDIGKKQTIRIKKHTEGLRDLMTPELSAVICWNDGKWNDFPLKFFDLEEIQHKKHKKQFHESTKYPKPFDSSIGFFTIWWLVNHFRFEQIDICGFTTEENYKDDDYFEYYAPQSPGTTRNKQQMEDPKKSGHHWAFERKTISQWIKDKKINDISR